LKQISLGTTKFCEGSTKLGGLYVSMPPTMAKGLALAEIWQ